MKRRLNLKRVLLVFASFYVGYILVSTQVAMIKIRKELNVRQQELDKLNDKNQKLQEQMKNVTENPDAFYEKQARERLGLVKEGETPVIEKK
jgi:cell division protein FtsB